MIEQRITMWLLRLAGRLERVASAIDRLAARI